MITVPVFSIVHYTQYYFTQYLDDDNSTCIQYCPLYTVFRRELYLSVYMVSKYRTLCIVVEQNVYI
jgi:hypothetical protein